MRIEQKEAETEALGSEIKTKENKLAGRLEKGAGLVAITLFLASSAMAEKAVEKIPTEPEKIRTELLKVVKMNEAKPLFLEQMELVKKPFATATLEKGEMKIEIETPKAEAKKVEIPEEAKPKVKLTEKEVEKKPPLG